MSNIEHKDIDLILQYLQKMYPEPVYIDGIFKQIGNDDWKFRESVKKYLIKHQLANYFKSNEDDGRFELLENGEYALKNGGIENWFQLINIEKQKEIDKENYKSQLEIEKSEREIDKLKYEKSVRELDSKIKYLTTRNFKLQNFQLIYGFLSGLSGFVVAFLSEHWFGLIQTLIRYLTK